MFVTPALILSSSKSIKAIYVLKTLNHLTNQRHYCSRNQQQLKSLKAIVGLEIHAQIQANSKLFSRGGTQYLAPPNSQLDLFDISLPGTLPSLNKQCVISSIKTALALNCAIQHESHFDRKHYYYSDLPAGYQLTQYHRPIAKDGYLDCIVTPYSRHHNAQSYDLVQFVREQQNNGDTFQPYIKRSKIKQIQLEQDSARSFHDVNTSEDGKKKDFSLVDFNRSGVALMEIVFEPDLKDQHEATSVLTELIAILKSIGTCSCQLEEGSLRVDANISIDSMNGQKFDGTGRVELKNLNSLRSLNRGIEYEILRQEQLLLSGKMVERETRSFDTKTGKSVLLRKKEESIDYRYFPEPSLPPINMSEYEALNVNQTIKQLPFEEGMELATNYKLPLDLVKYIISVDGMKDFLLESHQVSRSKNIDSMAKFLLHTKDLLDLDAKGILDDVSFIEGSSIRIGLQPRYFADIVDLAEEDSISFSIGYELIKLYVFNRERRESRELAESFGWLKISDIKEIEHLCRTVIDGMKSVSKKYAQTGNIRHMRALLQKLSDLTSGRVSVPLAKQVFDQILRPGTTTNNGQSCNNEEKTPS